MKLTLTQRALSPVINWAVERFFPSSVFYGAYDPFEAFQKADNDKTSVSNRLAPMAMVKLVSDAGADSIRTEIDGMTIKGEPVGDWVVHVFRKHDSKG